VSISSGCFYFKQSFLNSQDRNIQSSASEIKYQHISFLFTLLIKSIRYCCSCRFVYYSQDFQSCNCCRIFRRLSLAIIETCRYSNHSVLNRCTAVSLGELFHLCQNHRRNLLRVKSFCLVLMFDDYLRLVIWS
jgi:hypothetical protein